MLDTMKRVCFFLFLIDLVIIACVIRQDMEYKRMEKVLATVQNTEQKPKVAITFDDGPNAEYTEPVLDVLKEKEVKATFFIMGTCIEGNEDILKRMASEGHLIGNHTFHHVNLTTLSEEEACAELTTTAALVKELTGQSVEFVRPPFGAWNEKAECATDMIPVLWTIDTLDWCYQSAPKSLAKVVGKVKENDIILMHDQYPETVEALELIIDYLQSEGYELVTVDEILLD